MSSDPYLDAVKKCGDSGFTPLGWLYTSILDGYVERGLMRVEGGTYFVVDEADHWTSHAAQWAKVGPPLRPVDEDLSLLLRDLPPRPRVLVLGVTPEIIGSPWPDGASVTSVDRCRPMIEAMRGVLEKAGASSVMADWRKMPFPDSSFDVVVGDGCFPSLGSYEATVEATREIGRVLAPGGLFSQRWFVRPVFPDHPYVLDLDLSRGAVGGFHAFKLRLLTSMCAMRGGTVRLSDVWDRWTSMRPHPSWTEDEMSTMSAYRDSSSEYYFPTVYDISHIADSSVFELKPDSISHPSYDPVHFAVIRLRSRKP